MSRDLRVRDAVLRALLNDGEPAIRAAAITFCSPWKRIQRAPGAEHGGQFRFESPDQDSFTGSVKQGPSYSINDSIRPESCAAKKKSAGRRRSNGETNK